jgi:hypothetical protein
MFCNIVTNFVVGDALFVPDQHQIENVQIVSWAHLMDNCASLSTAIHVKALKPKENKSNWKQDKEKNN